MVETYNDYNYDFLTYWWCKSEFKFWTGISNLPKQISNLVMYKIKSPSMYIKLY